MRASGSLSEAFGSDFFASPGMVFARFSFSRAHLLERRARWAARSFNLRAARSAAASGLRGGFRSVAISALSAESRLLTAALDPCQLAGRFERARLAFARTLVPSTSDSASETRAGLDQSRHAFVTDGSSTSTCATRKSASVIVQSDPAGDPPIRQIACASRSSWRAEPTPSIVA